MLVGVGDLQNDELDFLGVAILLLSSVCMGCRNDLLPASAGLCLAANDFGNANAHRRHMVTWCRYS